MSLRRPHFDPAAKAARARHLTWQTGRRARRAKRQLALLVPLTAARSPPTSGARTCSVPTCPCGWRPRSCWSPWAGRWRASRPRRSCPRYSSGSIRRRPARSASSSASTFLAAAGAGGAADRRAAAEALAVGGAITAVVFGLAAQQTLGNLIAGLVLISARPFQVGDRVRLEAGGLAGQLEGVVASLDLRYTTFAQGDDSIMVRTTSCSPRRSCRCASGGRRPAGAAAAGRTPERGPGPARGAHAHRSAVSRTSASRRSTPTRSWSASR